MSASPPKAVVLLSGGLDSATTLAVARAEGYELHALTIDYGQRHRVEMEAAERLARSMGADHKVVPLDLRTFGGSALTSDVAVPKDREAAAMQREIPITYVPARNTIFLSLALAWAEVLDCCDIFVGINAVDYSGYPDCRPRFVAAFETMAQLATKAGVEGSELHIHVPLIHFTKAEIIRRGLALDVDYSLTHSCYDPDPEGRACGRCDSCKIRAKAFEELGIPDPALSHLNHV